MFAKTQSPGEQAEHLSDLSRNADAVSATAVVNHPVVTKTVGDMQSRGIPTFALLSDFAQAVRHTYIGLNNLKIGRTAAWILAKTARRVGKVAIFVGGHRWHGHELREAGFRSYFREYAPHYEILETPVSLETRRVTHEATLNLLHRHADIQGILVADGGMEGQFRHCAKCGDPRKSRWWSMNSPPNRGRVWRIDTSRWWMPHRSRDCAPTW